MAIKITNSSFHDNEVGISLPNNADAEMDSNVFVRNKKGIEVRDDLINTLKQEILTSTLDNSSKTRLIKEILEIAHSKKVDENKKNKIISTLRFIGDKTADLFVQVLANIITR